MLWFWFLELEFAKLGNKEPLLLSLAIEPKTLGDLYYALGSLSVSENIFFDSLIVFSIISLFSLVSGRCWL